VPAELPQKIATALFGGAGRGAARPQLVGRAVAAEEIARPRRLPMRPELAAAEARVSAMSRHLKVTEQDIAWCLGQGRWSDAAVVIARLAGDSAEFVMRAFDAEDAAKVLPLMRLACLSWATVLNVLDARSIELDASALPAVKGRYEALSRDAALEAWRDTKSELSAALYWSA
jgi:hypothetical protein